MNRPALPTRKTLPSIAALLMSASALYGQYNWTSTASGTRLWSDSANWSGASVPPSTTNDGVSFVNSTSALSYTVSLTADQVLGGGLTITPSTSNSGLITFTLNGGKMTFKSGNLLYSPASIPSSSRYNAAFTSGTYRFEDNSSIIMRTTGDSAGNLTTSVGIQFGSGATLDSEGLGSILVASSSGNYRNNMVLDLSGANLISGANEKTLTTSGAVEIGVTTLTGPSGSRDKIGRLQLGVLSELEIGGSLSIGVNSRTSNVSTSAIGALAFSTAPQQGAVRVLVNNSLRVGVGAGSEGTIESIPNGLDLELGNQVTRGGAVEIGYKNVASANASGNALGTVEAGTGSLSAYVTALHVGQNLHAAGSATGTFDFSESDLEVLDISGGAFIGEGTNAVGTVRLAGGSARSNTVAIGNSTATNKSLLRLETTTWSVSSALTIGAKGAIEITLGAGGVGGLDLLFDQEQNFVMQEGGSILVTFDEAAGNTAFWGLRMVGNHVDYLDLFKSSGALGANGLYAGDASLFYDGVYTYYGLQAVPEPSELALLALGGMGLLLGWKRRTQVASRAG